MVIFIIKCQAKLDQTARAAGQTSNSHERVSIQGTENKRPLTYSNTPQQIWRDTVMSSPPNNIHQSNELMVSIHLHQTTQAFKHCLFKPGTGHTHVITQIHGIHGIQATPNTTIDGTFKSFIIHTHITHMSYGFQSVIQAHAGQFGYWTPSPIMSSSSKNAVMEDFLFTPPSQTRSPDYETSIQV